MKILFIRLICLKRKKRNRIIVARVEIFGDSTLAFLLSQCYTQNSCIIFAFLGSNGAGKTTIVNILSTLLRKDGGSAAVHCFDVDKQAEKVRESISRIRVIESSNHEIAILDQFGERVYSTIDLQPGSAQRFFQGSGREPGKRLLI